MKCGLVTVETRPLPNIREIVENHIHYTGWPVTFFHGFGNGDFVKKELEGLNVKFREVRVSALSSEGYNNLLTSAEFWEAIPYEKVLMFQHDSRLLRKGIEEFLEWDYVGSPWKFQRHGGNGGLSLRSKKAMLDIIKTIPYHGMQAQGNEDVFFCNVLLKHEKYKLAPRKVCELFSCESIMKLGTLGIHAVDKHLSKEECEEILNQYVGKTTEQTIYYKRMEKQVCAPFNPFANE